MEFEKTCQETLLKNKIIISNDIYLEDVVPVKYNFELSVIISTSFHITSKSYYDRLYNS